MHNPYSKPSGHPTNPELLAAVSGDDSTRNAGSIIEIHKDSIQPDPNQPRKMIPESVIQERQQQLESEGQLSLITVWPAENRNGKLVYKLLDGECRWRAALASSSIEYLHAKITSLDPEDTFKILKHQLLHNDDGAQALTNIERSAAYYKLVQEAKNKGSENPYSDVAKEMGKHVSEISRIVSLVDLPKTVVDFSLEKGIDDPKVLACFKQVIRHGSESELEKFKKVLSESIDNKTSLRAVSSHFVSLIKKPKNKGGIKKKLTDKTTRQLNVKNIKLENNNLVVETAREIIKLKLSPEQITQLLTT